MQIDWFTLAAQAVNFLVLVWLLRRFLYGRIVRAMDAREAAITARLDAAARERTDAEREATHYRTEVQKLADERERILARSREEANTLRQQLVEEARADAEKMKAQWVASLRREEEELLCEFRERTGRQVLAIARRALTDLAGAELEPRMIAAFLERLARLEPAERGALAEEIRRSDREVQFRTAFTVDSESRERVTRFLREHLEDGVTVRFEVETDLGCGVELRALSRTLQWNLESYLDRLEEAFFERLEQRARGHDAPTPNERAGVGAPTGPNGGR